MGKPAKAQAAKPIFEIDRHRLARRQFAPLGATRRAGLMLPPKLPATWAAHCKCVGDGQKALLYLGRDLCTAA